MRVLAPGKASLLWGRHYEAEGPRLPVWKGELVGAHLQHQMVPGKDTLSGHVPCNDEVKHMPQMGGKEELEDGVMCFHSPQSVKL